MLSARAGMAGATHRATGRHRVEPSFGRGAADIAQSFAAGAAEHELLDAMSAAPVKRSPADRSVWVRTIRDPASGPTIPSTKGAGAGEAFAFRRALRGHARHGARPGAQDDASSERISGSRARTADGSRIWPDEASPSIARPGTTLA